MQCSVRLFEAQGKQSEQLKIVQTVHLLHVGSNTAHLDITSSNIMHCTEGHHVWDQLRLIDFGFSQMCTKGKHCSLESLSGHHASELAWCVTVNPTPQGFLHIPNTFCQHASNCLVSHMKPGLRKHIVLQARQPWTSGLRAPQQHMLRLKCSTPFSCRLIHWFGVNTCKIVFGSMGPQPIGGPWV